MPTVSYIVDRHERATEGEVIAHSRLRSAAKHLHKHLGSLEAPGGLTKDVFPEYRKKRRKEGKAKFGKETALSTIRRELGVLQAALEQALDDKLIPYVPKIPKPPRGKPRPWALNPLEVWRLWEVIPEGTLLFVFVMIAVHTGARLSAICELTWDRVDFHLNLIDFRSHHELEGRMKKRAIVPMCRALRLVLQAAKVVSKDGCLIGISPRTIQRYFAEAVQLAGLPKTVTAHVLRHTAATMIMTGLSKKVHRGDMSYFWASQIIGNDDVATTVGTYIHLAAGALIPGVTALERQVDYAGFKKHQAGLAIPA